MKIFKTDVFWSAVLIPWPRGCISTTSEPSRGQLCIFFLHADQITGLDVFAVDAHKVLIRFMKNFTGCRNTAWGIEIFLELWVERDGWPCVMFRPLLMFKKALRKKVCPQTKHSEKAGIWCPHLKGGNQPLCLHRALHCLTVYKSHLA